MAERSNIWLIIAIVIIIIIVVIIIWIYVDDNERLANNTSNSDNLDTIPNRGNLNDSCTNNEDCKSHLICEDSLCKVPLSGECNNLNDCTSDATSCTNGICLRQEPAYLGQICNNDLPCDGELICQNNICRADLGGECIEDQDCLTGGCINGICVNNQGNIGDSCDMSTTFCQSHLICEQSTCKVSTGNQCFQDNDCLSNHKCQNNTCQPAKTSGDICSNNKECATNHCGNSHLYLLDERGNLNDTSSLRPIQSFSGQEMIDVAQEGSNLLILLDSGNIMRRVINDRGSSSLEMIKNNVQLEKLASLGCLPSLTFYGLSQNKLYQLDQESSTLNDWIWREVDWAPQNITHISSSQDGNYLWVQYPMINRPPIMTILPQLFNDQPTQYGILYQFTGNYSPPFRMKETVLPENTIRNYGRNNLSYLEVDLSRKEATRYPKGDMVKNYHMGALFPNGNVYKLGTEYQMLVRNVKTLNGKIYVTTNRQCQ